MALDSFHLSSLNLPGHGNTKTPSGSQVYLKALPLKAIDAETGPTTLWPLSAVFLHLSVLTV